MGISCAAARKQDAEAQQEGLAQTELPGVEHPLDMVVIYLRRGNPPAR